MHKIEDLFNEKTEQKTEAYKFSNNIEETNKKQTLLFYPHGNLILCHTRAEQEEKKIASIKTPTDIDKLARYWKQHGVSPLFVSEGTSDSKLTAINSSAYLKYVYHEALPRPSESLVIYGWGIGKQDEHILAQLKEAKYERIAVSIRRDGNEAKKDEAKVEKFRERLKDVSESIVFFDAQSRGCWNNE